VLEGLSYFKKLQTIADTNKDGIVSNIEFYEAMNPIYFNVDYIYDDFKWDHCQMEADFSELDTETLQLNSFVSPYLKPQRQPHVRKEESFEI
jgi:hypothetical protein